MSGRPCPAGHASSWARPSFRWTRGATESLLHQHPQLPVLGEADAKVTSPAGAQLPVPGPTPAPPLLTPARLVAEREPGLRGNKRAGISAGVGGRPSPTLLTLASHDAGFRWFSGLHLQNSRVLIKGQAPRRPPAWTQGLSSRIPGAAPCLSHSAPGPVWALCGCVRGHVHALHAP